MAIRGENVGTAYVRILADGSGLDKSIRKAFKDTDGAAEESGRRSGEKYTEAWQKEFKKRPRRKALRQSIVDALAQGDYLETFRKSNNWQEFRTGLAKEFGDAGRVAADNFEKRMDFSGIGGIDLGTLKAELARAEKELARERKKMAGEEKAAEKRRREEEFAEALRDNKAFNHRLMKDRLDADKDWELHIRELADLDIAERNRVMKERLDRDKEWELHVKTASDAEIAEWERVLKERLDADKKWEIHIAELRRTVEAEQQAERDAYKETQKAESAQRRTAVRDAAERKILLRGLRDEYKQMLVDVQKLSKGEKASADRHTLMESLDKLRDKMRDANALDVDYTEGLRKANRELFLMSPKLNRVSHDLDQFGEAVGKSFGKGSRNDFVNIIGSMAGGIAKLPKLVFKAGESFMNIGRRARLARDEVLDAMGTAAEANKAFAKSIITDIGKFVGAVAGSVAGAFLLIGPLLSIVSLAAGVVTALASTIALGLVGAVGALGGALAPVIFGVGAVVLALKGLNKEQKKLVRESFAPLRREFKELGAETRKGLFTHIKKTAENLRPAVAGLRPLFRHIGESISDIGLGWSKMLASKGFQHFSKAMDDFIPGALERIGRITGHVFGGMGGLLVGLIPITRRFLRSLDSLTERFSDWANSTEGQNKIRTYFQKAGDSASQLIDFLGSLTGLLNTIITSGSDAGDTLFQSMTKAIDKWNDALKADPDILKNWFNDAVEFGKAVGKTATAFGKLFDMLDTETSRSLATSFFSALAFAIEGISDILSPFAKFMDEANRATGGFVAVVAGSLLTMKGLNLAFGGIAGSAKTMVGNLRDAETRMATMKGAAGRLAGPAGVLSIVGAAQTSNKWLKLLGNTAGGALLGFEVGGPWGAAIGAGVGALGTLAGQAQKTTDTLASGKKDIMDYASSLDAMSGAATGATRALVFKDAAQQGVLGQAHSLGVSSRLVVDSVMGVKGASERLQAALAKNKSLTVSWTDSLGATNTMQVKTKAQVAALTKEIEKNGGTVDKVYSKGINDEARRSLLDFIGDTTNAWKQAGRAKRQEILATQDLSALQKKLPRRIYTKVEATGIVPTLKGIATVTSKYHILDKKKIQSIIDAVGVDATVADVRRVMKHLDDLGRKHPVPKVGVDHRGADQGIGDTNRKLDEVGRKHVSAHIGVDTSDASTGIAWLNSALAGIHDKTVHINTVTTQGKKTAVGGMFSFAQNRLIAESGPEAVVPLNRPLAQVDPAVRWLSAIAQGKMTAPGEGGGGKKIDASGWTILSPSADPRTVAVEVLNSLVAQVN